MTINSGFIAATGPSLFEATGMAYLGSAFMLLIMSFLFLFMPGLLLALFSRRSGELQPADPVSRAASFLLDWFFLSVPVLVCLFFLPVRSVAVVGMVFTAGYFIFCWMSPGRTLGQALAGVRVVDRKHPHRPLRAWQSLMRTGGLVTLSMGWVTLLFSRRGALVHDVFSSTWPASGTVEIGKRHWLVRMVNVLFFLGWISVLAVTGLSAFPQGLLMPLPSFDGVTRSWMADLDGDGELEALAIDRDENGVVEALAIDGDGNGVTDRVRLDLDQDRFGDYVALDLDEDGQVDGFDTIGDGIMDTPATADGTPAGFSPPSALVLLCLLAWGVLFLFRLMLDLAPARYQDGPVEAGVGFGWRLLLFALAAAEAGFFALAAMLRPSYRAAADVAASGPGVEWWPVFSLVLMVGVPLVALAVISIGWRKSAHRAAPAVTAPPVSPPSL